MEIQKNTYAYTDELIQRSFLGSIFVLEVMDKGKKLGGSYGH